MMNMVGWALVAMAWACCWIGVRDNDTGGFAAALVLAAAAFAAWVVAGVLS